MLKSIITILKSFWQEGHVISNVLIYCLWVLNRKLMWKFRYHVFLSVSEDCINKNGHRIYNVFYLVMGTNSRGWSVVWCLWCDYTADNIVPVVIETLLLVSEVTISGVIGIFFLLYLKYVALLYPDSCKDWCLMKSEQAVVLVYTFVNF